MSVDMEQHDDLQGKRVRWRSPLQSPPRPWHQTRDDLDARSDGDSRNHWSSSSQRSNNSQNKRNGFSSHLRFTAADRQRIVSVLRVGNLL